MSAVRKLDDERINALVFDATRGTVRFFEQVQRALREPITVADLLRYREDNAKLVKTVDFGLIDKAKSAVRELEAALGPAALVRDYSVMETAHKTVREVREFVEEVCTAADPLLQLRRKR